MKSVIQAERECWICGTPYGLQVHHLLHGTGRRKKADRMGYWIYLCAEHHTGITGVHNNPKMDLEMKRMAQRHYEQRNTREDFIREFGKSWL